MTPKISVIIAVYNRFDLLKSVVETILAQTLPVEEIILVDDGSIDDTPELLPRYIAEHSAWRDRCRYIYQDNQGQSAANNTGIAAANGDWLAFNANDDLWLPQKLELQFRALEKYENCQLCFTDAWFMNTPQMKSITLFEFAGKEFPGETGIVEDPVRLLVRNQPVWMQTVVAHADLVRRVGGLDPQLRFSEDYDFAFRMALQTKFCYVGLPMVIIDRTPSTLRHSGASLNWQKKEFKLHMDGRRLEKQWEISKTLAPDIQSSVRDNLRGHYSKWVNHHLKSGNYEKATEAAAKAAMYKLTPGTAFKWALTRLSPRLAGKVISLRDQRDEIRYSGVNA
jgi:glycosyltransferase involved in cell wall biosynthesis